MEKYPFNCAHIFTCVSSLNYSQLFVFIAPVQLDKRCIHTDHIQWVETRVRVRDPRLFSPQFTISLFGYWTQYSLARVSNAEFPLKIPWIPFMQWTNIGMWFLFRNNIHPWCKMEINSLLRWFELFIQLLSLRHIG